MCVRKPGYKILQKILIEKYTVWKRRMSNVPYSEKDTSELKNYMSSNKHFCKSNLWTQHGNGMGYYGLCLKEDKDFHKQPTTTSKAVEKVDVITKEVLDSWPTIAKAAEYETISAARMSRSISNNITFKEKYFYRIKI